MSLSPLASNTYTLLIGVSDYPGLGPGSQLPGPHHDVQAWLRFARQGLGVPDALCHVMISEPDSAGVHFDNLAEAPRVPTLEQVHHGLEAMMNWLHEHRDEASTALVVFSGHGANLSHGATVQGAGLGLAMADTREEGDTLHGILPLAQLEAILRRRGLANRVTVVIDACYTALSAKAFDRPRLFGTIEEGHVGPLNSRLLLGSGEYAPAFGMQYEGNPRGVFSVALLQALSLWKVGNVDGVTIIEGAYQDILYRTRLLMTAMGFDEQQPVYAGSALGAVMPFNQPNEPVYEGTMSVVPDALRWEREIGMEDDALGFVLKFQAYKESSSSWVAFFALIQAPEDGSVQVTHTNMGNDSAVNVPAGQQVAFLFDGNVSKLVDNSPNRMHTQPFQEENGGYAYNFGSTWTVTLPNLSASGTWSFSSGGFPSAPDGLGQYWFELPGIQFSDDSVMVHAAFLCLTLSPSSDAIMAVQWCVITDAPEPGGSPVDLTGSLLQPKHISAALPTTFVQGSSGLAPYVGPDQACYVATDYQAS